MKAKTIRVYHIQSPITYRQIHIEGQYLPEKSKSQEAHRFMNGLKQSVTSRLETFLNFSRVSVLVLTNLVSKKSLNIGLEKFQPLKKSRSRSRKYLVSKKSLSIGLENIWSQKKSRYGSRKFGSEKILSIGLERYVSRKSHCNGLQKVLVFHIFPDRK